MDRIEAIVVNHNTSHYVELALRSLLARHGHDLNLGLTVMDNASDDAGVDDLRSFAASQGIPIMPSGFTQGPAEVVNSHGEILADFVLSHPACSHYLFLDADVCFIEDGTIGTMRRELDADATAFAIQAKSTWDGKTEVRGRGGFHTKADFELDLHWTWCSPDTPAEALPAMMRAGRWAGRERCHPFCALIKNTPVFRRVVEHIGLSEAWIWDNRNRNGGFYDTLGLASHVMRTHGQQWICSSKMVFHFFGVSYDSRGKADKDRHCLSKLAELRKQDGGRSHSSTSVCPAP